MVIRVRFKIKGSDLVLQSDVMSEEEAIDTAGQFVESAAAEWAEVVSIDADGKQDVLHRFDESDVDDTISAEDPKLRRREIANRMQRLQNEVLGLRDHFDQDDPEFYAITMAWQALRVAWYVVDKSRDGGIATDDGKLANLEDAIKDLNFALEHDRGGRQ